MTLNNKSLTIIVPFYNEENTLLESVKGLINQNIASSIILVDDFSSDKSLSIAHEVKKLSEKIIVLEKAKNEGKGSAVIFAKPYITSSHIIVHDADLEYHPSDIVKLFEMAKQNPESLIIGTRTKRGIERQKIYKTLVFINKLFTLIFNFLNSSKISDITTCYMLMPAKFFLNNIGDEKGFCIEVEILSKFLRSSDKIIEIPIRYTGRKYSEGKKINLFDGFSIFIKIIWYSKLFSFLRSKNSQI